MGNLFGLSPQSVQSLLPLLLVLGAGVQVGRSMSKHNFSKFEAGKSSMWRELHGTFNVLSSSVKLIQGQILKHHTYNKNVERVLSVGRTLELQELVIDIFQLCIQHNIQLVLEWIPREENIFADEISKSINVHDYMLSPDIFAALDILWGPHTIDHFSSFKTRQIPRFCSHWRNLGAEVIDALSVLWSSENNWVFPPPFWFLKCSNICEDMMQMEHSLLPTGHQHHGGLYYFKLRASSGNKYIHS